MEKVNLRNTSKVNSSEAKAKQDVTNKHLRLPRNKESVSPRPDPKKKTNPQRNRELFDKRPRNRTQTVYERYRSEIGEDFGDDTAKKGCKKINLNHLLNFTLTAHGNRDSGVRRNTNKTRLPKYNKELFLQANCQFIARDNGNYSVHEKNPDILVEWSLIEEIRLFSQEVPLCPICLYEPVAAKITQCGHIYCWPCLLHYLALTDKTWQKCPICFDAVHKNELKSVSVKIKTAFNVGDSITMCLMKREKGSLLPSPVLLESPRQMCCVDSDDCVARYQKLLLAKKKDVLEIIGRERRELENALMREKDTPEACFIESALELLNTRENSVNSDSEMRCQELPRDASNDPEMPYLVNTSNSNKNFELQQNLNAEELAGAANNFNFADVNQENVTARRNHLESLSSNGSYDDAHYSDVTDLSQASGSPDNNNIAQKFTDTERKGLSYFYQAEDGQHIYMHNLNVRMLLEEYGSLENAPPIIEAKIVEIESVSMTEILRKRLRYLQHLPLTCEFQIVELDFSKQLPRTTLALFESDINKRKHYRQRKAREERQREKFIQQEENKKLGKYPKATYNLESIDQFPACQTDSLNNFPEVLNTVKDSSHSEDQNLSSSVNSTETGAVATTSFAQMLKDGPKSFSKTVQEKNNKAISPMAKSYALPLSEDEDYVPAPEFHQSFSDAIQAALESVSIQDSSGKPKTGKKKKGKKQLLFTTSMNRNK